MALFKIYNNIDNPRTNQQTGDTILPETYNKGYMYFDANKSLFYIDTDGNGSTTGTRVALNSHGAFKSYADENEDRISTTYLKISDIDTFIHTPNITVQTWTGVES